MQDYGESIKSDNFTNASAALQKWVKFVQDYNSLTEKTNKI